MNVDAIHSHRPTSDPDQLGGISGGKEVVDWGEGFWEESHWERGGWSSSERKGFTENSEDGVRVNTWSQKSVEPEWWKAEGWKADDENEEVERRNGSTSYTNPKSTKLWNDETCHRLPITLRPVFCFQIPLQPLHPTFNP